MTDPSADDRRRDTADGTPSPPDSTLRTIWQTAVRLVGDLLVLTLWVVFLTLFFLGTTWPRWAFYGLLLGGVAVYVSVTAPWVRGRVSRGS